MPDHVFGNWSKIERGSVEKLSRRNITTIPGKTIELSRILRSLTINDIYLHRSATPRALMSVFPLENTIDIHNCLDILRSAREYVRGKSRTKRGLQVYYDIKQGKPASNHLPGWTFIVSSHALRFYQKIILFIEICRTLQSFCRRLHMWKNILVG